MARANVTQGSFLGGEWSQSAQGRMDLPSYSTAMNTCRNGYPTEEGAWTRRPGFLELGAAYMGSNKTVNVEFSLTSGVAAYLEETYYSGHVYFRMWTPLSALFGAGFGTAPLALLPDDIVQVTAISTANPAEITLNNAVAWATGDIIQIYPDQSSATSNCPQLSGRQLIITKIDTGHFTIADMVTGFGIDGSTLNFSGGNTWAAHIATIQTPYTSANDLTGSAALTGVRAIQTGQEAFFLSGNYAPHTLSIGSSFTATGGQTIPFSFAFADALFSSTVQNYWDGPYADALAGASQTGNSTGSISTSSGSTPNFTITDGAYSFVSTDAGRQIRLWIQPAAYDGTISYTAGQSVTYGGEFWLCTTTPSGAGVIPGTADPVTGAFDWTLTPTLGNWRIGAITSVISSSTVATNLNGGAYAVTNTNVDTWQLGLYTTGAWPTCGTFHEGRLWLAGASPGRFDAGVAGQLTGLGAFSPTDAQGNVTDASAIDYTLNTPPQTNIVWMLTDNLGVVAATNIDEWLISSGSTSAAISPTAIQGRRMTRYGAAAIEPIRIGLAILFVQAEQRQLIEYITDPFAGRYVGWRLNTLAKHLTADGTTPRGIIGITYQEEPTPIIWATRADNTLIGCTYRRESTFGSTAAVFFGWHRHDYGYAPEDPGLGKNIAAGGSGVPGVATAGGGGIVVSTSDPNTSTGYLEMANTAFSENTPIAAGGTLDGSPGGYLSGNEVAGTANEGLAQSGGPSGLTAYFGPTSGYAAFPAVYTENLAGNTVASGSGTTLTFPSAGLAAFAAFGGGTNVVFSAEGNYTGTLTLGWNINGSVTVTYTQTLSVSAVTSLDFWHGSGVTYIYLPANSVCFPVYSLTVTGGTPNPSLGGGLYQGIVSN